MNEKHPCDNQVNKSSLKAQKAEILDSKTKNIKENNLTYISYLKYLLLYLECIFYL